MNKTDDANLICLGIINGAHGIRGQVKIRSFTSHPKDIASYGDLCDQSGKIYRLTVVGRNNDILIASIEGISDRNDAEKLRNVELFIKRGALPDTVENEYYHSDLIGLKVTTEDGATYGQVICINNFGAGDIVEITLLSGKEEAMPFNKTTFPVIDIKNKKLVIAPPDII